MLNFTLFCANTYSFCVMYLLINPMTHCAEEENLIVRELALYYLSDVQEKYMFE